MVPRAILGDVEPRRPTRRPSSAPCRIFGIEGSPVAAGTLPIGRIDETGSGRVYGINGPGTPDFFAGRGGGQKIGMFRDQEFESVTGAVLTQDGAVAHDPYDKALAG
jgi:hypothetical protein